MKNMQKLGIILIGLIVALAAGVTIAEKPQCGPDGDKTRCGKEGRRKRGGRMAGFFKAIDASDEQKEKLKPIMKAHHEKVRAFREANKDKQRQAQQAMQSATTKEEYQAANKQMRSLFKARMKLHQQLKKELAGVLSESQLDKATAYMKSHARKGKGHRGPRKMFKGLNLTEDQKAKIKDIMTDARKKGKGMEGPQRHEVMRDAMNNIMKNILTADQAAQMKKNLKKFHKGRQGDRQHPLKGIATDEQMEQIKDIMTDAKAQAKNASPEERREIMQAARKKIANEVLNEEQRGKLYQKMQKMHRKHGRGRMMKGFSEEQKAAAKKIMEEAKAKAKDASPDERHEIMKAAHEKIRNEVMTAEQREKAKKMRGRHRGRRGGPGRGRGERGPRHGGPDEDHGPEDND